MNSAPTYPLTPLKNGVHHSKGFSWGDSRRWVPAFAGMIGLMLVTGCSNEIALESVNWKCPYGDTSFYEVISINPNNSFVEVSIHTIPGELPDVRSGNAFFSNNKVDIKLYEIPDFYGECVGTLDTETGIYKRQCNSKSNETSEMNKRKSQLQCFPHKRI